MIDIQEDIEICSNSGLYGRWRVVKDYDIGFVGVGQRTAWTCLGVADMYDNGEDTEARVRTAEFIAHFNPKKVRELLEYIEELEGIREEYLNILSREGE